MPNATHFAHLSPVFQALNASQPRSLSVEFSRSSSILCALAIIVGPSPAKWWGMMLTSPDDGLSWTKPVRLPDGILGTGKNRPVQLTDGVLR